MIVARAVALPRLSPDVAAVGHNGAHRRDVQLDALRLDPAPRIVADKHTVAPVVERPGSATSVNRIGAHW